FHSMECRQIQGVSYGAARRILAADRTCVASFYCRHGFYKGQILQWREYLLPSRYPPRYRRKRDADPPPELRPVGPDIASGLPYFHGTARTAFADPARYEWTS